MIKMRKRLLILLAMTMPVTVYANEASNLDTPLVVKDCHIDGMRDKVKCGTLSVPENYVNGAESKIDINFTVLPAIDGSSNKTPLMFLAGGPGQAATELALHINRTFRAVRNSHDIILVDQRGTGESHPLQCDEDTEQSIYQVTPEDFNRAEIERCLAEFTGDLSQFNSENAIRDFDAVRAALGYQKLHLYGGSYGTRAALVYMRMFPNSLESVVLDSVGPIEVPIGPFGQSAARSFELLVQACQEDKRCNGAYPNLQDEFEQVVAKLVEQPINVDISHPRLGTKTELTISKNKFINTLRMQLYSMETRTLVPLVIHQAFLGNYQPFAGLLSTTDGGMGMYVGLTLNIVCNEDMPKVTEEMFAKDANNRFGQDASHQVFKMACALWPKYQVEQDFYQPVTADIPTLILSGNLDPVTPPSNGDYTAATLPNNRHLVSENNAHIVASTDCAIDLINTFIDSLDLEALDDTCLTELPSETFMTNLNGSI